MAKRNRQNQAPHNAINVDVGTMDLWKAIAQQALPAKLSENEWIVLEYATAIQQASKSLAAHYPKINTICNRTETKAINIGFSIKVDRMNTPPEITGRIGYSEAFGEKFDVKVPDPNQTELPFDADDGPKGEQQELEED